MENNTQTEKVFVNGMMIRMPNDKAPEFVLLEQSIKVKDFFEFCKQNMDEKGWLNITIKRSQKGTIYSELNQWKPKTNPEQAQSYNDNKYKTSPSPEFPNGVNAYNHPLTTDKEREEMDARDALEGLDQIPF